MFAFFGISEETASNLEDNHSPPSADEAAISSLIDQISPEVIAVFGGLVHPNFLRVLTEQIVHEKIASPEKTNTELFTQNRKKWLTHCLSVPYSDPPWHQHLDCQPSVLHAMSQYILNIKSVEQCLQFVNKLADSQAFMLSAGYAGQNENVIMTMLELYNYERFNEGINGFKGIFSGLLAPLKPMYDEYQRISKQQNNALAQTVNAILPVIIIVGFVIAITTLLAPLELPSLVFSLLLIPLLYVGSFLASQFIQGRNCLYYHSRVWYHGGRFELPEFKVNPRMESIFHTEECAEQVRQFYIYELNACEEKEQEFAKLKSQGKLTSQDIEKQQESHKRKAILALEWHDIHSNCELGTDDAKQIAMRRIAKEINPDFVVYKGKEHNNNPNFIAYLNYKLTCLEARLNHCQPPLPNNDAISQAEQQASRTSETIELYQSLSLSRP